MNQICKVCGEPAAGFHFGAFTCEGCKSFFGRTYNNISSLSDCKNNGRCVINKKTRTSCKSCRLRKCLLVGMSKSGSRYGRRSNWFKIHFLMQNSNNNNNNNNNTIGNIAGVPTSSMPSISNIDTWEKLSNGSVTSKKCSKDKCFLLSRRSENNSPQSNILPDIEMNQGVNEVQPEIRSAMQRKFNGEIIVNPERKDLDSPNPSSSDSHSSDSSVKENGETTFFPSYVTGSLYPKDLLSLYNIPALGQHRLPPYINPASLASRFLYPYYPNLLSLYSRSQYIDTIISEAKSAQSQTTKSKPSICSRSEDTETTASKDFQPPLKALKRNPSCSPPMSYLESPWSTNSSPSYPSPTASPKAWKPSSSCHDSKQVVKSEHKGNETTETHNQNSPMDLSVRTKALNGEELTEHGKTDEESDESVQEENYKVAFLIDEIVKERKSSKTEQQIPLDLSGFKT